MIEASNNTPNGVALRGSASGEYGVAVDAEANTFNARAIRLQNYNGAKGMEVYSSGSGVGIQVIANNSVGINVQGYQPGISSVFSSALGAGGSAIEGVANSANAYGVNAQAYNVSATALRAANFFGGEAFRFEGGGRFDAGNTARSVCRVPLHARYRRFDA